MAVMVNRHDSGRSRPIKCSAVISDVDGTLVTNEKVLTERTKAAQRRSGANGTLFSIISSRPLRGLRMLVAPLDGRQRRAVCVAGANTVIVLVCGPSAAANERRRQSVLSSYGQHIVDQRGGAARSWSAVTLGSQTPTKG